MVAHGPAARERLRPIAARGRGDGGGVFRRRETEGQVPVAADVPQIFGDPLGEAVGIFEIIAPSPPRPAQPRDELRSHFRKDVGLPQYHLDGLQGRGSLGSRQKRARRGAADCRRRLLAENLAGGAGQEESSRD
jgi:hypothetical protein